MAGSENSPERIASIFLWGFMGAGKSTLGKALAQQCKMPFIDLDHWIVVHQGMSIAELFRQYGEAGFRDIEREALKTVIREHKELVLSCGGGTPCIGDNAAVMKSAGLTVFIDPSPGRIIQRLLRNYGDRPLIAGKSSQELAEYVHITLLKRRNWYQQAHVHLTSAQFPTRKDMLVAILKHLNP